MPSLFVAGTDTSVGKTIVTAGLAGFLREQEMDCGVMKPIQSGTRVGNKESDAYFLKEISGVSDPLDLINTYSFAEALAPGIAAEHEGIKIQFENIAQAYQKLTQLHRHVLVEGAGGLLVPLGPKQTIVDLIEYLNLPVLIIARLGLGTLNHTLLSLEYLKQRQITVVGVVLNHTSTTLDLSTQTNPQVLQSWTKTPLWGIVERIASVKNKQEIMDGVKKGIGHAAERYFSNPT